MEDLYSRIESLCVERRKNVTEMCREAGVPRGNLTDLKKGRQSGLSAVNMDKIARYFGVSVGYLLGNEQYENKPATNDGELINGDRELTEYLQELASRDEMRMLFHVTKSATKEQIEAIVKMVEAMKDSGIL